MDHGRVTAKQRLLAVLLNDVPRDEPDAYDYEGDRWALRFALCHEADGYGYVPTLATEPKAADYTTSGKPARAKPTAHRAGRHWQGPPMGRADEEAAKRVTPQDGKWHKMNQEFLAIMDADEAVMLSFLFNWRERWADKLPEKYRLAGWCYCTVEDMERHLFWDRKKQGRVLAKLKGKAYIEVQQHRRPSGNGQPVRWVRFNYARIADDLEHAWNKRLYPTYATEEADAATAALCVA